MECMADKLREKIAGGKTVYGTHTSWGGAMIAEMYGVAGFDVVWIDTEHGTMDPAQVQNALIGARAGGLAAFVRIPWHKGFLAKPILDIGADGIIFPMINTAEDARRAVAACRYPPGGERGYGPFRASRYGSIGALDYINVQSRKVWALLQIEHIDAVRNLDEIVKVPDIDALIVGPCDLSGSLGVLGQVDHPEVKKAMDEIAAKAKAAKIPVGVSAVGNDGLLRDWVRRGADLIFCDNEGSYIMNGCRKTLARLKEITGAE